MGLWFYSNWLAKKFVKFLQCSQLIVDNEVFLKFQSLEMKVENKI
jgi:hypothetical protein